VLERWDAVEAVEMCDRESVTFSVAVPVFLKEMADLYETTHREASRPARIAVGGANTPPDLIERADRLGIFAWRGWGMSEAPSLTLGFPDDPLHLRATTDGRLDIGTQVQAVDESRSPLPAGAAGELRVRSPKQMLSYLDPDQTAGQVDDSGWFYTGDIGSVTSDGWVTISGRIKDIVNRGGEKFSAVEIEAAIAGHADVDQVAVVGVPHERLGETVAAFVVLRRGRTWQGPDRLLNHVRSAGLARQKLPEHWVVVDALPLNATGKVRKDLLRDGWAGPTE
jgi:acyl-CoA synthetase (AMP-forming)/AMP-acid ligase II